MSRKPAATKARGATARASGTRSSGGRSAAAKSRGGRSPAARRDLAPARWPLIAGLAVAAVLSAVIVFAVRNQDGGGQAGATAEFGHVHGLAVDHGTGTLFAATHVGLFRIDDGRTAVRVSQQALDLMGFTAVGPGRFLASGHPGDPGDGPANLGLIESTDGGATWQTISLSGAADFHGLRAAHGAVYGYNSTDGAFMVSTDRKTWDRRSTVAMGAFVVSPADADTVLAAGRQGLQRSTDGGRTWAVIADTPNFHVLTWDEPARVWAVAGDGEVWASTDGGASWQRRGQVQGEPHAIGTHEDTVFVAIAGDVIVASDDGGATWTDRYRPPSA